MIPCSSILTTPPQRSPRLPAPPRSSEPRQTASRTLPRPTSSASLSSFRRFGPTGPRYGSPKVEAQFSLACIPQDRTRYNYVVAHLDARYANEVRDILASPPTANLYEHLKTDLIRRLSLSEDQKAQLTLPFDQLAGIANRVIDVSLPQLSPTVQAVAATPNTIELAHRIDDINRQLSTIQRRLDQHLPTRHSHSRGRNIAPSQQPGDDDRCYYNRRFAKRARQSRSLCSA
ncbi:hypothetical protein HPB49_013619 [Dermacentor silvarum]|uniref:Uncharacterized protein n=1 Tax=Dermacentor silvarum TaxID=543639 RepID=A0ACB8DNZ7_DERSI|nr:hypothetical protein HPB49_013619 [Dermacentor silvarum]